MERITQPQENIGENIRAKSPQEHIGASPPQEHIKANIGANTQKNIGASIKALFLVLLWISIVSVGACGKKGDPEYPPGSDYPVQYPRD